MLWYFCTLLWNLIGTFSYVRCLSGRMTWLFPLFNDKSILTWCSWKPTSYINLSAVIISCKSRQYFCGHVWLHAHGPLVVAVIHNHWKTCFIDCYVLGPTADSSFFLTVGASSDEQLFQFVILFLLGTAVMLVSADSFVAIFSQTLTFYIAASFAPWIRNLSIVSHSFTHPRAHRHTWGRSAHYWAHSCSFTWAGSSCVHQRSSCHISGAHAKTECKHGSILEQHCH